MLGFSLSSALTITQIDDEPRVLDTDLAEKLGMAKPENIRTHVIRPNMGQLEAFGIVCRRQINTGKRGRPGMAYYLNEEQALLVCLLSRTERAKQVRADVVRVYSRDGTVFASSRDVAAFFGKRHTHVLDSIKALLSEAPSTEPNFRLSEYQDSTGRTLPAYEMTRDGFTLLAMGLTGKTALAFKVRYIDQFNRMEARLKAPAKPALFDWQTSSFSASHRARQRPALVRLGSFGSDNRKRP